MGAGDRWARATEAARQAVQGIGPDDRATVVLFDAAPAAATPSTASQAALRMAIDTARVGAGVTRYAPALSFAARVLARSPLRRHEVVLVSDFQRAGWPGTAPEARLPAGTVLTPVDVGGAMPPNVAVAGVELQREVVDGRERVRATARVVNTDSAARAVSAALELNGRQVQARPGARASRTAPPRPRSSRCRCPRDGRAPRCASIATRCPPTTRSTSPCRAARCCACCWWRARARARRGASTCAARSPWATARRSSSTPSGRTRCAPRTSRAARS
jgi:hypothetical protein